MRQGDVKRFTIFGFGTTEIGFSNNEKVVSLAVSGHAIAL